nr:MAG TPA: hypothetical protein [Herelleviridae sp.]DAU78858.1 MAG TPA: hypothetical protein [Herelleviridae sp.]
MIFVHNIKQREPPASVTPLIALIYRLRLSDINIFFWSSNG